MPSNDSPNNENSLPITPDLQAFSSPEFTAMQTFTVQIITILTGGGGGSGTGGAGVAQIKGAFRRIPGF